MKPIIKTFRDLFVWQKSMSLVTEIYRATSSFPKEELYGLTAQLRRAAVSMPSNIAEGYARRSRTEYSRFIQIACGSLYELQTQLEIARNLHYLNPERYQELHHATRELESMLASPHRKLATKPSAAS